MRSKSWLLSMEVSAMYRKRPYSTGLGIHCSGKGSSRRENPTRTLAPSVVSRVSFTFTILCGPRAPTGHLLWSWGHSQPLVTRGSGLHHFWALTPGPQPSLGHVAQGPSYLMVHVTLQVSRGCCHTHVS